MAAARLLEQTPSAKTAEWRNVDLKTLRGEIIPRDRPAVLKGLAAHWPIVRAAAQSPQALLEYVRAHDRGRPTRIMVGRPDIKGLYMRIQVIRSLTKLLPKQLGERIRRLLWAARQ